MKPSESGRTPERSAKSDAARPPRSIKPPGTGADRSPRSNVLSNVIHFRRRIAPPGIGADLPSLSRSSELAHVAEPAVEVPTVRSMPVAIYLSDEGIYEQVEAAVKKWLATANITTDPQASLLWDRGSGP